MAELSEATREALRSLAQAVAQHRRHGGVLDGLPERQQRELQAMDGARRMVFMEELARADAELGKDQFRATLGQWRSPQQDPDLEGTP